MRLPLPLMCPCKNMLMHGRNSCILILNSLTEGILSGNFFMRMTTQEGNDDKGSNCKDS